MKFMKNEEGFTGLEAAIVLIAFVVVAAVFSYVMLGAGFFTSQKSQEVVHTSVAQASSSVELAGSVIGSKNTTDHTTLDHVNFTVSTTAGGNAFDLNTVVITYRDDTEFKTLTGPTFTNGKVTVDEEAKGDMTWTVYKYYNTIDGTGNEDVLVEPGEQVVISCQIAGNAGPNDQFTLELKPAVGSPLAIKRTVPPQIDWTNILY